MTFYNKLPEIEFETFNFILKQLPLSTNDNIFIMKQKTTLFLLLVLLASSCTEVNNSSIHENNTYIETIEYTCNYHPKSWVIRSYSINEYAPNPLLFKSLDSAIRASKTSECFRKMSGFYILFQKITNKVYKTTIMHINNLTIADYSNAKGFVLYKKKIFVCGGNIDLLGHAFRKHLVVSFIPIFIDIRSDSEPWLYIESVIKIR